MHYPIPALFAALLLGLVPPQGQAVPAPAPKPSAQAEAQQEKKEKKEKKVWTNEDLERLRLTSPRPMVIGSAAAAADTAAAAEVSEPSGPPQREAGAATPALAQENDPAWYRQRAAALRAELDQIDSELARLRNFLREPSTGQAGIGLSGSNASLTPENQINLLERRRQAVRQQLDDLEAQARRNSISPGVLR